MALKYNAKTGEWEGVTGGVDLAKLGKKSKTLAPAPVKQKKTQSQIENTVDNHHLYGYMKRLTLEIFEMYEIIDVPVVFRNLETCMFAFMGQRNRKRGPVVKTWNHRLEYGYQLIQEFATNGYQEYPTVGHMWCKPGSYGKRTNGNTGWWTFEDVTGLEAAHRIVLHECAHAIAHLFHGDLNSGHKHTFKMALRELMELYPFGN